MTHTLHRLGSDEELLKKDYVVLVMPSKDINHEGSGPKLRRFLEMARESGAIKLGDCRLGNEYHQGGLENLLANVEDRAVVHAVFNDQEALIDLLKKMKEADLGMSVVVSGLFDEVKKCAHASGLEPHTINQSLGRWGNKARLPEQGIVELQTMCGHGMVAVNLIKKMVDRVKKGKLTPEEAAENLFKPCMCGVFNPYRAAKLIRRLAEE